MSVAMALAEDVPSASGPIRPAALHLVRKPQRRHALALEPLSDAERQELHDLEAELRAEGLLDRPRTRGDCIDGPRPCPWVGCRAHLFATILTSGAIKPDHPDLEVWEMAETCSLDLADQHCATGMDADEVGAILNVTPSSVHQHEHRALASIKEALGEENLHRIRVHLKSRSAKVSTGLVPLRSRADVADQGGDEREGAPCPG